MNKTNSIFIIIGIIWLFTLFRSILIMMCGKKIFKKANRNPKTAMYPILNLFSMLEICDINTFFGILLFIPVLNFVVLFMMSYKLGVVFNTGFGYKIGLLIFPLMCYPLLSISEKPYKVSDDAYFKAMDSARGESINLMTDEEINKQYSNYKEDESPKVDSVFKSNIELMEQVEPYKAAKIDLLGLEKIKNHVPEDDPTLRDLGFGPKKDTNSNNAEFQTPNVTPKPNNVTPQVSGNTNNVPTNTGEEKKNDFEIIDL